MYHCGTISHKSSITYTGAPIMFIKIHVETNSEHVAQLYTGFGELHQQGVVSVEWCRQRKLSASPYAKPRLRVVLNGQTRILYDMSDTHIIDTQIDSNSIDLIFKRTFRASYVKQLRNHNRVFPLGLNYFVLSTHDQGIRRALWADGRVGKLKLLLKRLSLPSKILGLDSSTYNSSIASFEAMPNMHPSAPILFAARLWKPYRVSDSEKKDERIYLNELRINLVRALRREFGNRFIGGIQPDEYSSSIAPDCLLHDRQEALKSNWQKKIKQAAVCITTNGLKGSWGWKLAEYVAASRSIVSECNDIVVPGGFEEGMNFLAFNSIDDCIENTAKLIADDGQRYQMMLNNARYYHSYLRPDMLVLNSLIVALTATR